MPVAPGFVCCPGMDECRVRMDALERPSRDTCTSLCVAGAGDPHDSRDGGGSLRQEQAVEGRGKVGQRREQLPRCRERLLSVSK